MVSSKRNGVFYGEMIQPENAVFMMFQTAKNDPFVQQNTKGFIINSMFLAFVVFFLKFAFAEILPSIFQVIGILGISFLSILFILRFIRVHNTNIVRRPIKGFFHSIFLLSLFIILLGVF